MIEQKPRGIECRTCGCCHFFVVYTRPKPNGQIMRRKACRNCGRKVTTFEQTVTPM